MASNIFARCAAAMVLLWFSFPPLGWFWLAWLALLPLISIVVDPRRLSYGNYWTIWFAGLFYWLGTFYFIPIPHPLLWIGWIVISLYLACYLPFFVLSSRTLIRRFSVPPLLAVPIAWTGWELIRCYAFTGMPLVCLSHTQFQLPIVIQISDLSGAYTLTFAIMLFTTALYLTRVHENPLSRPALAPLLTMLMVVGLVIGYGYYQKSQDNRLNEKPLVVALIQGSIDTVFPKTTQEATEYFKNKTQHYIDLTQDALQQHDDIELIVWPENGWPYPDLEPGTDTSKMLPAEVRQYKESNLYIWPSLYVPGGQTPSYLVGAESYDPIKKERYASALHISPEAKTIDRYYKKHLVMFGEYVPLAQWIPLLQKFPAIGTGLKAGTKPVTMNINERKISPNICFESTVPHHIRSQVNQLSKEGQEPDILVNLTNDGWFYGTSCLDFHLACNVFRAVEMRKPHLVCANTGLSAVINDKGEIEQQGPRREPAVIRAEVIRVDRSSLYRTIGDAIPITFAIVSMLAWLIGMFLPLSRQQQQSDQLVGTAAHPPTGKGD